MAASQCEICPTYPLTSTAAILTKLIHSSDVTCICTSSAFQDAATQCLTANCTADELQAALALQAAQCGGRKSSPVLQALPVCSERMPKCGILIFSPISTALDTLVNCRTLPVTRTMIMYLLCLTHLFLFQWPAHSDFLPVMCRRLLDLKYRKGPLIRS